MNLRPAGLGGPVGKSGRRRAVERSTRPAGQLRKPARSGGTCGGRPTPFINLNWQQQQQRQSGERNQLAEVR